MNTISRIITGTALFILGVVIIVATLSESQDVLSGVWGVISGLCTGGVGVYVFFNKKEDDIEEIKNSEKII
jgi:uncharacterized membrane protein HdeD (DUF308 family)